MNGWMYTGDIGTIVHGSNALKIIDRKKNIFKLSQGVYVAPDRLQTIYRTAYGVSDLYIHGDSLKSCLVGIVVVDEDSFPKIADENSFKGKGLKEWVEDPRANEFLLGELNKVAKENELKGFEKLKRIYVSGKNFADLGLLTTTAKVKRSETGVFFKDVVAKLYEGLG